MVLLMHNAAYHGSSQTILTVQNVRICFLPPNTTSLEQPLDEGVIRLRSKQMSQILDCSNDSLRAKIY